MQLTALPSGVTASPASFTLAAGTSQQVSLTIPGTASSSTTNVTVSGTSGTLSHSTQFALKVSPSTGPPPSSGLGRTHYVRTDSITSYEGFVNQQYAVFDPLNRRFFIADPYSNRITVFDAGTQKFLGSIHVPGAFGIDETPDHKTLYAGTQLGDVYAIDPALMTVTKRYIAAQIGPYGYQAFSVRVLADGRLALLGGQGGIPNVDGYASVAVWNPNVNSITVYASFYGGTQLFDIPFTQACSSLGNIGGFTLTGDRSHIVLLSIDSDGTVCSLDPATGSNVFNNNPATGFVVAASPDGHYLVSESGGNGYQQAVVLDAKTLDVVREFPINTGFSGASSFVVSADSSTLYMTTDSIVYAYNLATGQLSGWLPNLFLTDGYSGLAGASSGLNIGTEDDTGLLVGPMSEGVGFLDTTALRTGKVGSDHLNGYLTPATGPTAGGTQVNWSGSSTVALSAVSIGGQLVSSATEASNGQITATTPAAKAGPADVYSYFADGGALILPEAFSYGPTLLQTVPNVTTVDGGGTGLIFGYGFGPTSSSSNAIPSDLKISVGGKPVTITGFYPNAYGLLSPPFLLQAASYSIPALSAQAEDVTVSTSAGSTTQTGGMQTIPALQQYSLPGAALEQGIYDRIRDVYYFTDATKVQVFSRTQGAWLPPIPITPPGGTTTQRLWGVAISPDGSKLAVSDAGAAAIYLLDPASGAVLKTLMVPVPVPNILALPAGLAISDSGVVYYTTAIVGGTGFSAFFKWDTKSGTITDYKLTGPGLGQSDTYLRAAISSDNSRVFFNDYGLPFNIDTATDNVTFASSSPGCCYGDYDLSLSPNQTGFAATGYMYDTDLNARSFLGPSLYDALFVQYVYGEKLSPDGSLYFQPSVNGIDVYDGRLGNLLQSIALPFPLSQGFDALVSDGRDNVLIAITGQTGSGIAVLDLTSLQEPNPLPYAEPFIATYGRGFSKLMTVNKPGSNPHRRMVPHVFHAPSGINLGRSSTPPITTH